MMEYSQIAAEGGAEAVREIAQTIVDRLPVRMLKPPSAGMVMVRQIDPLENIPFLLGEAYVTECEVEVDGRAGYGCVLGSDEERALCSALLDAVFGGGHPAAADFASLLEAEEKRIRQRWEAESTAAASTRVSFETR
jgi:alpha-D-ribose 1-methylphosphonate 5-triphosphate synthase subunit PhnG